MNTIVSQRWSLAEKRRCFRDGPRVISVGGEGAVEGGERGGGGGEESGGGGGRVEGSGGAGGGGSGSQPLIFIILDHTYTIFCQMNGILKLFFYCCHISTPSVICAVI